ncbi:hypothetical protein GCM10023169_14200 [Georgenia halophila]|uniref:Uncharacterized protein n=1 Tax=Georgenia halophila TaxID=620889 RepID=A0ABP8L292_9MICO
MPDGVAGASGVLVELEPLGLGLAELRAREGPADTEAAWRRAVPLRRKNAGVIPPR